MIEIRNGRLGKSVHAARRIDKGEVILQGWGDTGPERSRHTFQIDHNTHIKIDSPIELVNHSCDPNCGLLIRIDARSVELHALRDIKAGEELSHDYAAFEDDIQFMTGPCLCTAENCRGRITGYQDLPADRREALGPYVAEYLRGAEAPVTIGR